MCDALVKVEGLAAGYGEVQVLWVVSFKARRGQLTANGAGKTTTLRALGTIAPWRGPIVFEGEDVTRPGLESVAIYETGVKQLLWDNKAEWAAHVITRRNVAVQLNPTTFDLAGESTPRALNWRSASDRKLEALGNVARTHARCEMGHDDGKAERGAVKAVEGNIADRFPRISGRGMTPAFMAAKRGILTRLRQSGRIRRLRRKSSRSAPRTPA
jgi:energy-coupling factor transporter ATP-binding protein EcfA2